MTFKLENWFDFLLLLLLVCISTYVISNSWVLTIAVAVLLIIGFKVIFKRKIIFEEAAILVKTHVSKSKHLDVLYSQVTEVYFEQFYSTIYLNIVVKMTVNIDGKERVVKFNVNTTQASESYRLLQKHEVKCRFSNDYAETLIVGDSRP